MQVTEVRLMKADPTDSCKAYGSITLDGDFVVCGIRVLEKKRYGTALCGLPVQTKFKRGIQGCMFPDGKIVKRRYYCSGIG